MPPSRNLSTYTDCVELWQKSIRYASGIKIKCDTRKQALGLRLRLYVYRNLLFKEGQKSNPNQTISTPYDHMEIVLNDTVVVMRPRQLIGTVITEGDEIPSDDIADDDPLLLEARKLLE